MSGLDISPNAALPTAAWEALAAPARTPPADAGEAKRLRQSVQDFEAILLYRLLQEMKQTIPESGLLGGGVTQQFQDVFWLYLAQDLAAKGGLGLCEDLVRQLAGSAGEAAGPRVEVSR
jgi:flagellar protein FlgJ